MKLLPDRYSVSNVRSVIEDPGLLLDEGLRLKRDLYLNAWRLNAWVSRQRAHEEGKDVMAADWDVLLLLDACRYDWFIDSWPASVGKTGKAVSRGSSSEEFLREAVIQTGPHHDTVYITANPYVSIVPDGTFHFVENLLDDCWDPNLETVPPGPALAETERILDAYPNKRVLVHLMQPHFPFIGDTGAEFDHSGLSADFFEEHVETPNPWTWSCLSPETPTETVLAAYRENHEIVVDAVADWVKDRSERIVVSADHANFVGERTGPIPVQTFGHPTGFRHPAVRTVPWTVIESTDRRKIEVDPPVARERLDESTVSDRLEALGYAE